MRTVRLCKSLTVTGLVFCECLCLLMSAGQSALAWSETEEAQLSQVSGKLVSQRRQEIILREIGGDREDVLSPRGRYPRWSFSGDEIVFIEGTQIMVCSADRGSRARVVAEAEQPRAVCFTREDTSVLFSDGKMLKEVNLTSGVVSTRFVAETLYEVDSSRDGRKIAVTEKGITGYRVRIYDAKYAGGREVARGCSASLSPEGTTVTALSRDHRELALFDTETLERIGSVRGPGAKRFDNHAWTNSPLWLVATLEGEKTSLALISSGGSELFLLTPQDDYDRGDAFLDTGAEPLPGNKHAL